MNQPHKIWIHSLRDADTSCISRVGVKMALGRPVTLLAFDPWQHGLSLRLRRMSVFLRMNAL